MNIKTKFILDQSKDMFYVWVVLHMAGKNKLLELAGEMQIEYATAKQIHEAKNFSDVETLIKEVADERYTEEGLFLEDAVKQYQKAWDEINDHFYKTVHECTGFPWQYTEYIVVVSPFHFGLSNRNQNFVIRSSHEKPYIQTRITAHEILMIQVWHMFEETYGKNDLDKAQEYYWGANEITTSALLGTKDELNSLWHNSQKGFEKFLLNYPQLTEMKIVMKKQFIESKSFLAYLGKIKSMNSSS